MSSPHLLSVLLTLAAVLVGDVTSQEPPPVVGYVYLNGLPAVSSQGAQPGHPAPAATVVYQASMLSTGWDMLNITTNPSFADWDQAYAAGFGEGAMTYDSVLQNYINTWGYNVTEPLPSKVVDFVQRNWAWMEVQVSQQNVTDAIWMQVGLELQQFRGLLDGLNYAANCSNGTAFTFVMLQSLMIAGDLYDLQPALYPPASEEGVGDWRSMTKQEYDVWLAKKTRCSAIIKLALDLSDVFFGHATWSTFNTMLRSYKHYHLQYQSAASKLVSFSSYPGYLSSVDDYYITDTGLAIIETSIAVINASMYVGNVVPESLLYWVRAMVVTRIATSGKEWVTLFAEYNSGTYNNQWMVLDLNLFAPYKSPLKPETLMIAEQLPGVVGIRDRTSTLEYGYWPSYNLPSIPELWVAAGYEEATQLMGWEMNDYQRCVRAQIFRRDQAGVFDMPAFMTLLQYNDFESDPISQGNPLYAIASRLDLSTPANTSQCFGAIDAKVSSFSMYASGRQVLAYSGPTPQQPLFDFSTTNATGSGCGPHLGMPAQWDYLWRRFQPFL